MSVNKSGTQAIKPQQRTEEEIQVFGNGISADDLGDIGDIHGNFTQKYGYINNTEFDLSPRDNAFEGKIGGKKVFVNTEVKNQELLNIKEL